MSSLRAVRRRACAGKIRHDSYAAGLQHLIDLQRSDALSRGEGRKRDGWMSVYRCQFCRGFHVGHMPKRVKQAIVDRRAAAHGHRPAPARPGSGEGE